MVLLRNSFFDVRFVVGLLHSSLLGPELGHARVLKKSLNSISWHKRLTVTRKTVIVWKVLRSLDETLPC